MGLITGILNRLGYVRAGAVTPADLDTKAHPGLSILFTPDERKRGEPHKHDFAEYSAVSSKQVWVYACIRCIAGKVASLPLRTYRTRPRADDQELQRGPLYDLLEQVNPYNNAWSLLFQTVWDLEANGNGYWYKYREGGVPKELWRLNPARVTIIPGTGDEFIKAYLYKVTEDRKLTFPAADIVQFKYPHPFDDLYGLPPLAAADMSVSTDIAAQETNRALLRNNAVPAGLLSFPGEIAPDTEARKLMMEEVEKRWRDKFGGSEGAGKVGVLPFGATFTQMAMGPRDMQGEILRRMTREEICAAFQVPPPCVGILDRSTYQNSEQADKALWGGVITETCRLIEGAINERLTPEFTEANLKVAFDLSDVEALRESDLDDREVALKELAAGALTINEYRQRFDPQTEDLPWGDVWWQPGVVSPEDGSMEEPPPPQAPPVPPAAAEEPPPDQLRFVPASRKRRKQYTEAERQAFLESWLASQEVAQTALERIVQRWLAEQSVTVRGNLSRIVGQRAHEPEVESILFDVDEEGRKLSVELSPALRAIYTEAADAAYDLITDEGAFDIYDASVRSFLEQRSVNIRRVAQTVADSLRSSLADGYEQGETLRELEARVREFYRGQGYEVERIARTESASTMNAASLAGYQQAGVKGKEWLTAHDPWVRPDHAAADGQKVAIDAPFVVGGYEGQAPGQFGVAAEDINCRCALLPLVDFTPQQ